MRLVREHCDEHPSASPEIQSSAGKLATTPEMMRTCRRRDDVEYATLEYIDWFAGHSPLPASALLARSYSFESPHNSGRVTGPLWSADSLRSPRAPGDAIMACALTGTFAAGSRPRRW